VKIKHKRASFQSGSLTTESGKNRPDVWVFRWRDDDGSRKKAILGTVKELNKAKAQKIAEEYRQQANTPQPFAAKSSLTVAQLIEHYTERELGEDSGRATKPRKAYLYIFANYVIPRGGNLPLKAVKAVAVEEWLKTLPLANGSKAKVREVFGAAFRHAMRHELYPINPIANVRQVRKRSIDLEILEPGEIMAIMNELAGVDPVRTAFLIAAVMGMRRGEIFGLKWADMDLERAVLHVRRSYVDGVVGPPKTESSRRPLPLPPQVVEALTAWKERTLFSHAEDWVFASSTTSANSHSGLELSGRGT
jgi:integrase